MSARLHARLRAFAALSRLRDASMEEARAEHVRHASALERAQRELAEAVEAAQAAEAAMRETLSSGRDLSLHALARRQGHADLLHSRQHKATQRRDQADEALERAGEALRAARREAEVPRRLAEKTEAALAIEETRRGWRELDETWLQRGGRR